MSSLSDLITQPSPPDIAPDREQFGDQTDIKIDDLRNKIKLALNQISGGLADTGVVPGDYPNDGEIPTFTVHADGRLYAAGSVPATFAATVPSSPSASPTAAVVPPILTSAGAVALTSTTATGIVTLTSNATFNGTTYTATTVGQPAYVAQFSPDGTFTMGRMTSATSTFTSADFNDYVTLDKSGIITSPGAITRDFSHRLDLPSGDISQVLFSVPFGKRFPAGFLNLSLTGVLGSPMGALATCSVDSYTKDEAVILATVNSGHSYFAVLGTLHAAMA